MNFQSFDTRCFNMVFTFLTIQEIDVYFKIKTIKIPISYFLLRLRYSLNFQARYEDLKLGILSNIQAC